MSRKEKREKAKSSAGHKILTVIGIILCVILIPMLVINITLIIRSYTDPDSVPMIAGKAPLIVMTDSMYPMIESGDLVFVNTAEAEDIKKDDVIAFYDPAGNGTSMVIHRVAKITSQDGNLAFRTKGDANNAEDRDLVPAESLVGTYAGRIAGIGKIVLFMQTTTGLIICVVVPILILVGYDIIRRRLYEKGRKKDTDALLKELEELRAKNAG